MPAIQSNTRSFIATADLAVHVRVKLDSTLNQVVVAGATEDYIGITQIPVLAGRAVPVRLKNSGGTAFMVATTAFAFGALVYGTAAGGVDDVSSGNILVGTALEAATGAGSVVEILLA